LQHILKASPEHQQAKNLLATLLEPKPQTPPVATEEAPEPGEPNNYEDWFKLAHSHKQKERFQKALDAFDAALKYKPGDIESLTGKGECFLDLGSNHAAITWFKRALKTNQNFGPAIIGLAEAYRYLNKKQKAVHYYKRYLNVIPDGPEAAVARNALKDLK